LNSVLSFSGEVATEVVNRFFDQLEVHGWVIINGIDGNNGAIVDLQVEPFEILFEVGCLDNGSGVVGDFIVIKNFLNA
jgi:hypothetical protein